MATGAMASKGPVRGCGRRRGNARGIAPSLDAREAGLSCGKACACSSLSGRQPIGDRIALATGGGITRPRTSGVCGPDPEGTAGLGRATTPTCFSNQVKGAHGAPAGSVGPVRGCTPRSADLTTQGGRGPPLLKVHVRRGSVTRRGKERSETTPRPFTRPKVGLGRATITRVCSTGTSGRSSYLCSSGSPIRRP